MKDFLGNEIEVGDILVVQSTSYKDLQLREVIKITDKMVGISRRPQGQNDPRTILRYVEPQRTTIAHKGVKP